MMQYALFARPVVTIYDLPQTTKQSEAGLVSTIGDEGLYGQACQVRTAPGGVGFCWSARPKSARPRSRKCTSRNERHGPLSAR